MDGKSLEKKKSNFKLSDTLILFIALVVIVVVFTAIRSEFFSYDNISTMLKNMVMTGILALGLTPLMIARGLDISFGASISFTGVLMAYLYNLGIGLTFSLIIGVIAAVIIGFINGLLIEKFDLIPIILTLGMMSILSALGLVLSKGQSISMLTDPLYYFATKTFLKIPISLFILIIFIIIFWFIMTFTKVGRTIYIIGANPKVATLSGIKVQKVRILLYTFMGLAAGIASIVMVSMTGVGNPLAGAKMALPVLSAVVLGGISLAGGAGSVWGTIIGVLIVSVIFNGLSVSNVPSYFIQVFQGLALILIVSLYEIRNQRAARR
ncbi:MAG: Ribose transport system permease protein RbsC [Actinobacteria bacterium ADurb.Bin346]|nr:MAG: Ribose transport system permease protein RbsC [Actinobacteria bacterium ADurb.Bin346]